MYLTQPNRFLAESGWILFGPNSWLSNCMILIQPRRSLSWITRFANYAEKHTLTWNAHYTCSELPFLTAPPMPQEQKGNEQEKNCQLKQKTRQEEEITLENKTDQA